MGLQKLMRDQFTPLRRTETKTDRGATTYSHEPDLDSTRPGVIVRGGSEGASDEELGTRDTSTSQWTLTLLGHVDPPILAVDQIRREADGRVYEIVGEPEPLAAGRTKLTQMIVKIVRDH